MNEYGASELWQQTWNSPNFTNGVHIIRFVRVSARVDIDAVSVSVTTNTPTPTLTPTVTATATNTPTHTATFTPTFTPTPANSGWVNPGANAAATGGLQPSLALSYSSQIVDGSTAYTQASWVGFGWSLDTPSIERNMHGTSNTTIDDTFNINVGGVSGMLLLGEDGYYHTTDESYWRIQYNAGDDTWTAWDKTGTVYFFEDRSTYGELTCPTPDRWRQSWRWSLTKVRNAFGQELIYEYDHDTKTIEFVDCSYQPNFYVATVAVYPKKITYSNNRYQIRFITAPRTDYAEGWDVDAAFTMLFQRSRLSEVVVEQDSNGDGIFETIIRKYVFDHEADPEKNDTNIFPGIIWSKGGKNLTLFSVQEYGTGETSALPATTFTYGDGMHLTSANNGYGGRVEFVYQTETEPWPWYDTGAVAARSSGEVFGNHTCYPVPGEPYGGHLAGWAPTNPIYEEDVYCFESTVMFFKEGYNPRVGGTSLIKPGAWYHFTATIARAQDVRHTEPPPYGTWAKIGISDGNGSTVYADPVNIEDAWMSSLLTIEGDFLLSTDASNVNFMFDTNGARMTGFTIALLPTHYRVLEKRIYDGINASPNIFYYSYEGAATNDAAHSVAATTATPYILPYDEFRGHSIVTETGPGGRVVVTAFNQDDQLKGRPSSITVQDANGNIYQQTEMTYTVTQIPNGQLPYYYYITVDLHNIVDSLKDKPS